MKIFKFWMLLLAVLSVTVQGRAQSPRTVRVGVVADGPSDELTRSLSLVKTELAKLTQREFKVEYPSAKQVTADWTRPTIDRALSTMLADPEVDIVFAFGVIASDSISSKALASDGALNKPCIAPFVVDSHSKELNRDKARARPNLSYVLWNLDLPRDLRAFSEVTKVKRLGWIHNAYIAHEMPALQAALIARAAAAGVEFVPIPTGLTAQSALASLPKGIDGVYLTPNSQLGDAERKVLAEGLIQRRLPSFSWLGRGDVELGFLAGLATAADRTRLARRVALNVQSVLLGEGSEHLVTAFKQDEQLSINMQTARAIGVWPNWTVLTDAVLVDQRRKRISRRLDLSSAVKEAMRSNLDLAVMRQVLASGREEIHRARASLLPQLSANASAFMIDSDRAGLGNAERTLQWGGGLSQLLFDERAWANLTIQGHLQDSREGDQATLKLDIAQEVALAYLNLLQAQTVERIRRENVHLSRDNLALARLRSRLGSAKPGEVLRWEAQIAAARRDVIAAVAARNQLEILVNRLLNRPLEEPFVTKEATIDDAELFSSDPRLRESFDNPQRFKALREFLVRQGARVAPEVGRIDALLRGAERRKLSADRALYLPRLGLSATATHRFLKGGAGADPFTLPAGVPDIPIPNPNNVDWYVGITGTLPLYEGGRRYAEINQSAAEVAKLRTQKRALLLGIGQRVRASLHQAGASYAAIRLSRESARAAKENLDLVSDAYSRGAAPIVTLLDAQNQALIADLSAANAAFLFLSDMMRVERSIGTFSFFTNPKQRDQFFNQLSNAQTRRLTQMKANRTRDAFPDAPAATATPLPPASASAPGAPLDGRVRGTQSSVPSSTKTGGAASRNPTP
jgi:outer membrane protein